MLYPPLHSLSYSIPYVIILLLYWFAYRLSENRSFRNSSSYSRLVLFVLMVYFFFVGFRGYICTDWYNYYPMFIETPSLLDYEDFITYSNTVFTEIGYLFYISFFKIFSDDYIAFQAFSVLIDVFLIHLCIKKYSSNYLLSFVLLSVFFYVQSVNLNRNIKSTLLFIYSIRYLEKDKAWKYFLLNSIGILFHSLSIVYLIIYFFLKKKYSVRLLFILFIVSYLFYFSRISVISYLAQLFDNVVEGVGKVGHAIHVYLAKENIERFPLLSVGMLERLLTFLLLAFNYNKISTSFKYGVYFNNMLILYLMSYLLLSEIPTLSIRFSQLFGFAYVIFYAYIFSLYKRSKNIVIYRWLVFIYLFLWTLSTHNALMDKYDNFLFEHKSFQERSRIYEHYGSDYIIG